MGWRTQVSASFSVDLHELLDSLRDLNLSSGAARVAAVSPARSLDGGGQGRKKSGTAESEPAHEDLDHKYAVTFRRRLVLRSKEINALRLGMPAPRAISPARFRPAPSPRDVSYHNRIQAHRGRRGVIPKTKVHQLFHSIQSDSFPIYLVNY